MKSPLDGDVSEKLIMGMLDPFSTCTLTFIRTIEMFVESAFTTVHQMIHSSGSCCIA
jgi:hypothetical protein